MVCAFKRVLTTLLIMNGLSVTHSAIVMFTTGLCRASFVSQTVLKFDWYSQQTTTQ